MGTRSVRKKQSSEIFEGTKEETTQLERWPPVLDKFLDELFEKKESTRENALSSLVQEFINNDDNQLSDFVDHKFATILYNCMNSIKKGSSKEVSLAARLLGLLAITTIPGGHIAQEILQESISPISQILKSNSFGASTNSSLIDCLGVVTFFGGSEKPEETEEALKTLSYLVSTEKAYSSTIESIIAAVSLLLTAKGKLLINPEIWKDPICFLTTILQKEEDISLWVSAAEALALAAEIPSFNNFLTCPQESNISFKRADLKGKVLKRMKILVHDRKYIHILHEIYEFLDFLEAPQESKECSIKTWGECLQMKFLNHFLGDSNGRSSFRVATEDKEDEYVDVVEDTKKPNPSLSSQRKAEKRLHKSKSNNSLDNKARTHKQRSLVEDSEAGYYTTAAGKSIDIDEEEIRIL